MLCLVVLLAFLAGALLAVGVSTAPARRDAVAERLARIADPPRPAPPRVQDAPPLPGPRRAAVRRLAAPLGASPGVRTLLERAGRPLDLDAAEFTGLRMLSMLVFLALTPLAAHVLAATLPMKALAVLLDLVVGLSLPDAWLQGKIGARQAQIRKTLPDVLDLLVVSMEAGVGFDAAVAQAAAAMRGPLPDEMRRALQEMRLGRTRAEALREMAARADVAELTSFVTAVIQADRLGAGVAATLRVQSETARAQRMQRVREAAARLPTKLLFPLVFFLMPALFVVLLGPGLINLMRVLSH
jgi:tight adherence protein C